MNEPSKSKAALDNFSDEQLQAELAHREWEREKIQSRIYRGELEATDADGVVTMADLQ